MVPSCRSFLPPNALAFAPGSAAMFTRGLGKCRCYHKQTLLKGIYEKRQVSKGVLTVDAASTGFLFGEVGGPVRL